MALLMCVVCEWREVRARNRCSACYVYLQRHGQDRPRKLVVAHGKRVARRAGVL